MFKPKTAYYMFMGMENLTEIKGMENLDTSECTNMYSMFDNCVNLEELDVSGFNTSNVTDMGEMFSSCGNLIELNLIHFDTSKVKDMHRMFYACHKLTATLNIMETLNYYDDMCHNTARDSGLLTLKYTSPVTSAHINSLVATKDDGNVVNGGQA